MTREHRPFDSEVVATADLAVVIKRWIKDHDRSFVVVDELKGVWNDEIFSGKLYLEEHSGISSRSITRITNCETKFTTFHLADKIVQAMERPDLWGVELQVVKNPRLP